MFGRLGYSPDEYYRMGFVDVIAAIEGYQDGEIAKLNNLRHQMWASIAAMNGKTAPTPQKLIPLPIDGKDSPPPMSKEEFLNLARKLAEMDRAKRAQA